MLDFNGNASASFQFVSAKFVMNGNANVTIDFDGVPVMTPKVRLVE